ncbi:MAG: [FeFe] hydrogenase H-cluster radical SAM maturase HydG [Candidatus Scalindua sp. AMX11]|nr:MAG: [FeFe] hydrogenase H-cluster radical SAM maturase HydG [Candidatus Scalindua sp.]NOG82739.1 [FeFe] hydrogenase H-cluster radical SAM maturase HydG [Planctomycetota bacterium]RZV95308.1 MAG: [FeFe] hydrogenase H-cluster radical SAM maturase HydG [Candidatus Scalindua sp. SCAELEC01]TDE66209.1 MAG: [FeFe] hydrogenase H-cluster radical SAM maturase HydG [Candidatus Scalindua sp. AMX11]GJQ57830.1 MAG: [FeFe] hydrogenase H-cluster radical SAM maturase HydG [Candidatus Scalindua sp.]
MKNFINEVNIFDILKETQTPSNQSVETIIHKSLELKGLNPAEAALLLNCEDEVILNRIFATARQIKGSIYGNRLVLFAPLYLSNRCINRCLYCGFSQESSNSNQHILSKDEVREETKALIAQGHKRLLLVSAEDQAANIDYLKEVIKTVYETKVGNGAIRRVNVNVAPMEVKDFKTLKSACIGTYQLFQETYHKSTYNKMHLSGPKSDYLKRLHACDDAQTAGIDDVGIGALFGLYDYKFEVLAILLHALHLEERFGVGPHTISIPRIEPAFGSEISNHPPYQVSDRELKKIVAILRLAVPYTGIILSTREKESLRNELFHLGVSQISAGSKTAPGGYSGSGNPPGQFNTSDNRSLTEVVENLATMGFLPSFCTSCYRSGRTGEKFMDLAKPGEIKKLCHPNALLTFEEYLLDHMPKSSQKIKDFLSSELHKIEDPHIRKTTSDYMELLLQGKRDLYL